MENCIFCKIVKDKIPCYKIYEDNHYLAFLDIYPRTKGHILVIPKKHYHWVYDLPEQEFGQYWIVVLKISKAIQHAFNPKFISYLTYGTDVAHAHIHILPHIDEDGIFPGVKQYSSKQLEEISEKIKKEI